MAYSPMDSSPLASRTPSPSPPPPPSLPRQAVPERPDYENEAVIRRGTLPHRTYYLPPEATLCLNGDEGEWEFSYAATPVEAPNAEKHSMSEVRRRRRFNQRSNTPPPTWSPITVPGHWQLEGRLRGLGDKWGIPQYTNVQYPIPVAPPYVPAENPTGTYRRQFVVPPDWRQARMRVRLRFDGVDSAYHVWLNGALVGYAQGSRNAAEFDITDHVAAEPETDAGTPMSLLVQVYQWSDGSYIEDQDQWWLSGIFRDVHLLGFPATTAIEDWFVRTDLDATYTDALLHATVTVRTEEAADLTMRLHSREDPSMVLGETTVKVDPATTSVDVRLPVANPRKWTAETPNLYRVELSLRSGTSAGDGHAHTVHQMIGFRKVELLDGLLCVNGTALRLRGTNRHDHHPLHGRAVPDHFMRHDLEQIKRFNLNALRCSHYPPHPRLLDVADELGLWVIDEADLECHGFYDVVARPLDIPEEMDYEERKKLTFPKAAQFTSDNPAWRDAYLDRIEALVQRDKNHASVIVWSLGNEAFYGRNHQAMYRYVKEYDPTRLVHYEGDAHAETADMYSYMYPHIDRLARLAKTEGVDLRTGKFDKPIILCEYAHAMGNGPGGLEDYEDLFRKYPRVQGGFIWEWANHGLWKEVPENPDQSYYAYGGDFGDYPNDGTFVMDGLCKSDHGNSPPMPGLVELKTVVQPVRMTMFKGGKTLLLENLYDFLDLSQLTLSYRIQEFTSVSTTLFESGELELPHIPPHEQGTIVLSGIDYVSYGQRPEILVTVLLSRKNALTPDFRDVAHFQQYLTPERKDVMALPPLYHSSLVGPYEYASVSYDGTGTVATVGRHSKMVFNYARGYLVEWTVDAGPASGGPMTLLGAADSRTPAIAPGFWRAPTDNDRPASLPYWKRFGVDALRFHRVTGGTWNFSHEQVIMVTESVFAPPALGWGWNCKTSYTLTKTGALHVIVTVKPFGSAPTHVPRIGLDLRANKSLIKHFQWYGKGPGESYPDKSLSQLVGIYKDDLAGLQTPYEVPQENGNRMGTGWLVAGEKGGDDGDTIQRGFRVALNPSSHPRTDEDEDEDQSQVQAQNQAQAQDQTSPGLASGFSWAASPYAAEDIDAATHPCDLRGKELEDAVLLRLDARVAGVGSAACGPGVRPDLLAKVEEVTFGFTLEPFAEGLQRRPLAPPTKPVAKTASRKKRPRAQT